MTQPLTDAINALTRYANETTGASDQTLSDAVRTLCDGYGGGGYDWDAFASNAVPTGDVVLTVTSVQNSAFKAKPITSLDAPNVTTIWGEAFRDCKQLKTINLPRFTGAGAASNSLFNGCSALESAYMPLLGYSQGSSFFANCPNLTSVDISSVTRLVGSFFSNCYALPFVDLNENCATIDQNVFSGCHALQTLVLRRTSVVTLSKINAFTDSPMRGYGGLSGEIYVPNDLIESYKTASNWATIFAEGHLTFKPIEGSIYE